MLINPTLSALLSSYICLTLFHKNRNNEILNKKHNDRYFFIFKIAAELKVDAKQVKSTVELLDEGATVPFISRYRKEVTGSLDEVQVITIKNEIERLRQLEQRREAILKSIEGQVKINTRIIR